jgi:hypothetical protein
MIKPITILFPIVLLCISCATEAQEKTTEASVKVEATSDSIVIDVDTIGELQAPIPDPFAALTLTQKQAKYDSLKTAMATHKRSLKHRNRDLLADSRKSTVKLTSAYLNSLLIEQVFPLWYGTEWDYNGITQTPGNGQIACGYFVSTTLKHMGFNLDRYALAKKYSHSIVNSLCDRVQVIRTGFENMMAYIGKQPNDLYVVGLDNHVGFIEKSDDGIFFIHSNYMGPVAVVKEYANESEALQSSEVFVLGHLLSNEKLINEWLNGTRLVIVD